MWASSFCRVRLYEKFLLNFGREIVRPGGAPHWRFWQVVLDADYVGRPVPTESMPRPFRRGVFWPVFLGVNTLQQSRKLLWAVTWRGLCHLQTSMWPEMRCYRLYSAVATASSRPGSAGSCLEQDQEKKKKERRDSEALKDASYACGRELTEKMEPKLVDQRRP